MSDTVEVEFDWTGEAPLAVRDLLEVLEAAGLVQVWHIGSTTAVFRVRIPDEKTRTQFIGYGMRGVRRREVE